MLLFDVLFVIACFVLLCMSVRILSARAERCRELALSHAARAKNLGEELQICQDIANSVPGWQTRADLYSNAARAVRALRNQFESITVADPEEIRAMQDQLSKVTEERDEATAKIAGLEAQVEANAKVVLDLSEKLQASRVAIENLVKQCEKTRKRERSLMEATGAKFTNLNPHYDVVLKSYMGSCIPIIKEIREFFGLPLKEAKDRFDSRILAEGCTKEETEDLKNRINEAGGVVSIRKAKS